MRVVLVAQRADASIVGGALRSNFAVRLTMRVDNTEAVRMLHPSADQALCERVARFGQAYGLVERPSKSLRVMKADHLPYERYVQAIRSTAPAPVRGGEGR